jgi:hypothetical protein
MGWDEGEKGWEGMSGRDRKRFRGKRLRRNGKDEKKW